MKKVFLFLIMFFIVGIYENSVAIENSITHKTPVIIQHGEILDYVTADDLLIAEIEKQLTCMAKNIFFEAAVESTAGRLAVAQVTLNRVKSHRFPNSVCEVVYEGLHYTTASGKQIPKRNRCQFSWYCDGKSDDPRKVRSWKNSQLIAKWFYDHQDRLMDITDGATHYHADWMQKYPNWARTYKRNVRIDDHIFYQKREYGNVQNRKLKISELTLASL